MRQWHQGKEGFMKVTRIQDKYNPDKVWMIKRYLCGTFYVNQEIKGNYEDYLVKSSEVVRQDFELVIYLAEDAATDGVDAQATKLIEDMMALTRGEMNTLYRDSIIQVLSTKIDNYRKTDILQPSDDMVLEQDKVIMAGDINVTVRNVVQSARGKE